ncbi:MAG TPA: AzlC family ABC transporter permease [Clostridiales bacterium]|nr:AzlC family ABC transporter permease [Clostridiales bacterium]
MLNKEFIKGIKTAIPVTLGYLPIGLAFGILASQQGLSPVDIFFMSLLVYAGSAQFIASAMLASGSAYITIIVTTFLINLRHLLMSASMSPYLKHISSPLLTLISIGITDETYAAGYAETATGKASPYFYLGLYGLSHIIWIMSTVLGSIVGSHIANPEKWGLDFALSAMFIGLLFMQIKDRKDIFVAISSGVLSVALAYFMKNNFNIITATIVAAFIGVCLEK